MNPQPRNLLRAAAIAVTALTTPALALPSRELPVVPLSTPCAPPKVVPGAFFRMVPSIAPLYDNEGNEVGISIGMKREIFALSKAELDYANQKICFSFQSSIDGVTVVPTGPECFSAGSAPQPVAGEAPFTVIATFPNATEGSAAGTVLPLITMTPERARAIYDNARNMCPSHEI